MAWGNYTGTLRWNSIFSERIFTNLTLLVSNYNYSFGNSLTYGKPKKESKFDWNADLLDIRSSTTFGYYMDDRQHIRTGTDEHMA